MYDGRRGSRCESGAVPPLSPGRNLPGSQELSPSVSSNQGVDTLSEDISPCAAADLASPPGP
ncbi:hypothetical protein STRIP9103_01948 [Streptomyces ipomoeae 91-03]|uniref:Uncharacterized protein n=1 Tax=Streptomyces ipomoeae 91-03 TaxID=698759 RepID=L1KKH3_9ACTN|nr:hypothetical protein STRIP9103_01948 [Streptomyces ipomoeae 91-03]